jgi:hypothetical protein
MRERGLRCTHNEEFSLASGLIETLAERVLVVHKLIGVTSDSGVPHVGKLPVILEGTLCKKPVGNLLVEDKVSAEQPDDESAQALLFC